MLVGREPELGRITRLLGDARLGRSRSLLLRGDPGIGKSALIAWAVGEANGFLVLRATGSAPEQDVPFAGLHALLRSVLDRLDNIPGAQASGLRAALALAPGPPDRLAAAAGTLSLLAAAADPGPVLVAVDDVQWLDRASAEALAFAARRLAGESIAILAAVRRGDETVLEAALEVLDVEPLDAEPALKLLHGHWGDGLARGVARRLVTSTGGNPLAMLEVGRLLTERQRTGLDPLGRSLPVTQSVELGVRRRLRGLDQQTKDALLVAAIAAPDDIVPVADLEAAEDDGLVRLVDGRVQFQHPLVAAAIERLATDEQRRLAHLWIAERLTHEGDADRRAWHLALAADGPDDAVADALEAAADRAHARGGYAAQAQALARAASLSTSDRERARRSLDAAAAAYWSGDPALAITLAERAVTLASDDPILYAAAVHRLAIITDWHGRWHDRSVSTAALEHLAAQVERSDPLRAVGLLGVILQRRFQALETRAALDLAERRVAMVAPIGDERHLRALQDLARATGMHGEAARCGALCDEILRLERGSSGGPLRFATNIAEPLMWLERYDVCRGLLSESAVEARAQDNVVRLMFELTNLALLDLRTGHFVQALAGASEVAELATETGNDYLLACNLAVLTRLAGLRGEVVLAEQHARRATEIADRLADALIAAEVEMALAESALAAGKAADAVARLEPLRELVSINEVAEPGVLPFAPDLIEAYARTNRPEDAERELDHLEGEARAVDRRWALAAAARCRGLMAAPHDIDDHFERALTLGADAEWSPFQMARTRLLYGERLRRSRRRLDARAELRSAIDAFDRMGAVPWSERARAELDATGETIPRRDPTAPEKLTPQELQIALQVAAGKSNRETAEALFLSPKTVEFHLTRVYRKLDLNSRAQLIKELSKHVDAVAADH